MDPIEGRDLEQKPYPNPFRAIEAHSASLNLLL